MVKPWRLGREREVAPLALPLARDVLRVEPEVERVVAQEALGVHGSRQVGVLARLERGEVLDADLGLALGAQQVDALALSGLDQSLRERGAGFRRVDTVAVTPLGAPPPCLVASRHAPSSSPAVAPSSRRRTIRAFEPSNAPT
jgi:hypothetical protein